MRTCRCCGKPVEITEASRFRTAVYETGGVPWMHVAFWECSCRNTHTVVLWEDEQTALDGERDRVEAEEQERLDATCRRPFFSTALELAELGL